MQEEEEVTSEIR